MRPCRPLLRRYRSLVMDHHLCQRHHRYQHQHQHQHHRNCFSSYNTNNVGTTSTSTSTPAVTIPISSSNFYDNGSSLQGILRQRHQHHHHHHRNIIQQPPQIQQQQQRQSRNRIYNFSSILQVMTARRSSSNSSNSSGIINSNTESFLPTLLFNNSRDNNNNGTTATSTKQQQQQRRWYSSYTNNNDNNNSTSNFITPPSTSSISTRVVTTAASNTTTKDDDNSESSTTKQTDNIVYENDDHKISNIKNKNKDDDNDNDNNNEESWKRIRTIQVPQYGHKDADEAVTSLQNARNERARAKTAANVRRALYGNLFICVSKLGAWMSSGSSSMMSEFVHSCVDCGNQTLLLMGLRDSRNAADKRHPYGYGKSVYFWALVSALGTFFMGAGISMSHSIQALINPSLSETISSEVWGVLAMSFVVDGYVLYKTFSELELERPSDVSMRKYISKLRDPATLAILLEDAAACLGIVIAIAGIGASHYTSNPLWDGVAGVGISCLLGGVGLALVRVNHSFLIGQGVERDMLDGIEKIIRNRRSIDHVSGIQSQWTGPESFSFKAEVDFDGTYLSALLMPRYRAEFKNAGEDLDEELEVMLSWYAEDVIRAVEREVRHIEAMIRQQYPGAEYIELEPMSKFADRFAIDDSFEEKLLQIEKEELQRWVRVLYETKQDAKTSSSSSTKSSSLESKSESSNNNSKNVVSGSFPSDKPNEKSTSNGSETDGPLK